MNDRLKYFALTIVLMLPLAPAASAQPTDVFERLRLALQRGDAEAVLDEGADRLEIDLLGRRKLYSRAQAAYVLREFFRRYPPTAFVVEHESQAEGNWFAAGTMHVRQGERPLHVYVRLRVHGDGWVLQELSLGSPRAP